jgi:hypothetical protein
MLEIRRRHLKFEYLRVIRNSRDYLLFAFQFLERKPQQRLTWTHLS